MKKLIAFCIILVFACCNGGTRVPGNVIAPVKMEKVMWDMVLADRYSAQFLARDTSVQSRQAKTFELYEKVFRIHKTNREEFIRSIKYYLGRPDITSEIFDTLAARAARKRPEMYKPVE